ncbi:MAG: DUF4469 domain-containing protein [Bacteroidales bacterium]|jgi:hypothetical protein|nr:DUF4469 domain-containing protein [Bacteroidales bacterium]
MANEKSIINVELYDLPITERKDDRCGRVVSARSLNEDDLIAFAVARRTDLSAAIMRAATCRWASSLIRQDSGEAIPVPATSILVNDPSKVTFILSPSLSSGDYKLQITTQFSNSSVLLNVPRTYLFDYVLVCT